MRRSVMLVSLLIPFLPSVVLYAEEQMSKERWETVLVMHFDEGKGLPKDASGYENHALECTAKWADQGKRGKCLYFDGKRSYVLIPMSPSLLIGRRIEIEAWIKPVGETQYGGIVSNLHWGTPSGWQVLRARGGRICFNLSPDGEEKTGCAVGYTGPFVTAPLGKWSHIRVRYDGKEVSIFVNGKLSSKHKFEGKVFTAKRPIWIGWLGRGLKGDYFHGFIDEVVIRREPGKYGKAPIERKILLTLRHGGGEDWGTQDVFITSVGQYYWMGRLVFAHQGDLKLSWRMRMWTLERSGKVYGVGLKWFRPLEPGYAYAFNFYFRTLWRECFPPDYVVIDNRKVWDWRDEEARRDLEKYGRIFFVYVPRERSDGIIWFVKDESYRQYGGTEKFSFGFAHSRVAVCRRIKLPAGVDLPMAPELPFPPRGTRITRSPKLIESFWDLATKSVEIDVPLTDPSQMDYPTDDAILMMLAGRWDEAGYKGVFDSPILEYIKTYRISLRRNSWRLIGQVAPEFLRQVFTIIPRDEEGGFNKEGRAKALEKHARRLNRFLNRHPKIKVFYFFVEIPGTGFYHLFTLPEFSHLVAGAKWGQWDPTFNLHQRMRTYFKVFSEWTSALRSRIVQPERVTMLHQTDAGLLPAAYYYKSGADAVIGGCIHRQNVNCLVSNIRGASRAYGKEWGLYYDCWFGWFWCSTHPEEFEHILQVFFASGARIIEVSNVPMCYPWWGFPVDNEYMRRWLKFCRYVRLHPKRGEQVVRIGVMRGFGNQYYMISSKALYGGWGANQTDDDRGLIAVFFPKIATDENLTENNLTRFCTGTPFGPVDMIPWDTPLEHLKKFGVVIFLGINAMDEAQYENLKRYVMEGGTLVMSLGQLRKEEWGKDEVRNPRRMWREDFTDFLGFSVFTKDGQPIPIAKDPKKLLRVRMNWAGRNLTGSVKANKLYRVKVSPDVRVLARTDDGAPVVICRSLGRGRVFCFVTEFMGSVKQLTKEFLSLLLKEERIVNFRPSSDWLEYMVQRKGQSYVIPVFNHGRGLFPSRLGRDHGPWEGVVEVDLDKLGLKDVEVFKVVYDYKSHKPFALKRLRHSTEGRILRFRLRVEEFEELVIGPKGRVRKDFFDG